MTKMKALSAVIILSAAIASPVFAQDAQDANVAAPQHVRTHDRNYRGAYNQANGSSYTAPLTRDEDRNLQNFGFSGKDPSRIGGEDPDLNPPG